MISFFLPVMLAGDVLVLPDRGPEAPPLERIGWEFVAESGKEIRIFHYLEPQSIRPISKNSTTFAVTTAMQWSPPGLTEKRRIRTQGYLVDCDESKIRNDWEIKLYDDDAFVDYRQQKAFREPKGWQRSLIERICTNQ